MKKVMIIANSSKGLFNFRRELLGELTKSYEVVVCVPDNNRIIELGELGCKVIPIKIDRRGINPVRDFQLLYALRKAVKAEKPSAVLTYTIKPNIYGGMVCASLGVPYISTITGMGTAFEGNGILKRLVVTMYRFAARKVSCMMFQNKYNKEMFEKLNVCKKTRLVPGSGVNLEKHAFEEYPEDDGNVRLLFIGRMMREKGIYELVEAMSRIRKNYPGVSLDMLGGCDEDCKELLNDAEKDGTVCWHGYSNTVHEFIKNSHATVLPSYHEGMANVLLESASSGRPVLASNIPGCMETFDEGVSGIGFRAWSVGSLTHAIEKFVALPYEARREMGLAGRRKMEAQFDRNIVVAAYMEEIRKAEGRK